MRLQLVPSPKWKLVVDIGTPKPENDGQNSATQISSTISEDPNANATTSDVKSGGRDTRLDDLVALLGENMPHDQNSPYYSYLSSFMSLRLMLLKPSPSREEAEQQATLLSSFTSYQSSGRGKNDIAVMIARDYMFLKQQQQTQAHPSPQLQSILSNHSVHPAMEHLSLPTHSASIVGNNMGHHGTFVTFPSNQLSTNNGTVQQYTNQNSLQQHNQRMGQQQLEAVESSNQGMNGHVNLPSSNSVSSRKSDP